MPLLGAHSKPAHSPQTTTPTPPPSAHPIPPPPKPRKPPARGGSAAPLPPTRPPGAHPIPLPQDRGRHQGRGGAAAPAPTRQRSQHTAAPGCHLLPPRGQAVQVWQLSNLPCSCSLGPWRLASILSRMDSMPTPANAGLSAQWRSLPGSRPPPQAAALPRCPTISPVAFARRSCWLATPTCSRDGELVLWGINCCWSMSCSFAAACDPRYCLLSPG